MENSTENAAQPQQDGLDVLTDFCKKLDLEGGGEWFPVRAADFDATAWGVWECWEHCKIDKLESGAVGAVRSGDWIAWQSGTRRIFGFASRSAAEMMAVLQNQGAPTRVVFFDGTAEPSKLVFETVKDQVDQEIRRASPDWESDSAPTIANTYDLPIT